MKTCSHPTCTYPVFSHLYCQKHQYMRTDKKVKKDFMKIKVTQVKDFPFGFSDQISMFGTLWELKKDRSGNVICPYTKERLNRFYNTEFWFNCFAHILCKKNYIHFKLNPANIEVVNPEFHRIIDQGTTKDREAHPDWKWDLWDSKVLQMKDEYVKFKKDNLLT
jgi:hypothetical protein